MTRRFFLAALAPVFMRASSVPGLSVRGKLDQSEDKKPKLDVAGQKPVYFEGDEATMGVLNDKRLSGMELEAIGHFNSPDRFQVDPIHTRALFVHKDGKRLLITYWCDVCYIRTYSPGVCWCCQKYTDLDLRDPDATDR